jgi:hypothetical protein
MKFRTEIKLKPEKNRIDHNSSVVLIGSCFSEHMEQKLDHYKFEQFTNPSGIVFHPRAIEKSIGSCVDQKEYCQKDLIQKGELWLSLDHHSRFSGTDPELVLENINQSIAKGYLALKNASHLIITLGTSWAYRWTGTGAFVANCHKIPQSNFEKVLLSGEETVLSLKNTVNKVREINPELEVIFTLSPVRHLKDGFVQNNHSKALLHAAIQKMSQEEKIHYFPAYEIMMDDLRDYRFYKSDMIHPSDEAVAYIWEQFANAWISDESRQLMTEIEDIQRALQHKPFDPGSKAHQVFLEQVDQKVQKLRLRHPQIKFNKKRK